MDTVPQVNYSCQKAGLKPLQHICSNSSSLLLTHYLLAQNKTHIKEYTYLLIIQSNMKLWRILEYMTLVMCIFCIHLKFLDHQNVKLLQSEVQQEIVKSQLTETKRKYLEIIDLRRNLYLEYEVCLQLNMKAYNMIFFRLFF